VLAPPGSLHDGLLRPIGADDRGVRTVVTYCHSGMQASFDYFVARYVGYPDVRLYDGSAVEWSALGFPLERSAR
jgi:3-mercaptopyruvate sulfurtransferase SseA